MYKVLFYLLNTILVFVSVMPLFAIIELINLLVVNRKKYVDNKIGKIVNFYYTDEEIPYVDGVGGCPTYSAHFIVNCTINGKNYTQEASRITYYWSGKKIKNDINKNVDIKYCIDKKGNIKLYIYEPKKSIMHIVMYLLCGVISVSLIIVMWKYMFF